jgi:hypothetical protein
MWNIPNHRRPKGMGRGSTGPGGDHVFAIARVQPEISIRFDPLCPARHAFMEPSEPIPLAVFQIALANTRPDWQRVWP